MTSDPCCALCKGPHGICLSRHTCQHHKAADAIDEANHQARQTVRRPTEDRALANIERQGRKKKT